MIVDGRTIAEEILARTKERANKLLHPPKVVAIVGAETPATLAYMRVKARAAENAGCVFESRPLGADVADADAVIVQLPLPVEIDQKTLLDSIPVEKDADVLGSAARETFARGDPAALLPPAVATIAEIFKRHAVELKGKQAVVVGSGFLVGQPAALWLGQQEASVTVLGRGANFETALADADIVVSGAGSPGLIKPMMLKQGVMLIDAGTSESGGTLVGDADPACAPKCSVFTPVPGGVGPIAVACLLSNVVTLAERALTDLVI